MPDLDSIKGIGPLGVTAAFAIICLILYAASFTTVPGGFGYFLGFSVLGFVLMTVIALFGRGSGSLKLNFR
jgi:FtsH-binding integral membrane protein